MGKNIIICCDGTGNEFSDTNTNVLRLYSILPKDDDQQLSFYDPGVGTMSAPQIFSRTIKLISKMLGLAFGYGIIKNIADAYSYLMRTYEPGDKVYLFGFSRGAYTVRALAALIHKCGLLTARDDNLIPYAIKQFRYQKKKWIAEGFKQTFSRECPIHFLGIWDTVKSVGWIYNPVKLPFTMNNPDVGVVRHAISIDESRSLFRQNLWGNAIVKQDVLQVWFAGVHSDVGGGYKEKQSHLSKICLQWMIEEARACGLVINDSAYKQIVPELDEGVEPSQIIDWQATPDYRGMIHKSLKGLWWINEIIPMYKYDWTKKKWGFTWPSLGTPRWIEEDVNIHVSVKKRLDDKSLDYQPPNLPKKYKVVDTVFYKGETK